MSWRTYWTEAPRFIQTRDELENELSSAEQEIATVDRSTDPEGTWRRGKEHLDPDRHAQVTDLVGDAQSTEGRLSPDIRWAEQENLSGMRLAGWDHRLKGEDRLKEKIAEELRITPAMAPEDAVRKINDAIRYTFCGEKENYASGYWEIKGLLESRGYEMFYGKNYWSNTEYKGINTRWVTPEGQRFEVQFHTSESFHAKHEVTHNAYERIRNPLTGYVEREKLKEFQREVSHWIPVSEDAKSIPNYRKEGC